MACLKVLPNMLGSKYRFIDTMLRKCAATDAAIENMPFSGPTDRENTQMSSLYCYEHEMRKGNIRRITLHLTAK
jgi:hypothetical protein